MPDHLQMKQWKYNIGPAYRYLYQVRYMKYEDKSNMAANFLCLHQMATFVEIFAKNVSRFLAWEQPAHFQVFLLDKFWYAS